MKLKEIQKEIVKNGGLVVSDNTKNEKDIALNFLEWVADEFLDEAEEVVTDDDLDNEDKAVGLYEIMEIQAPNGFVFASNDKKGDCFGYWKEVAESRKARLKKETCLCNECRKKMNEGFMRDLLMKKGLITKKNRKIDQKLTTDDLTDKAKSFLAKGAVFTISALATMGILGNFITDYQEEQNIKEKDLLKDLVKENYIKTPKDLKIAKIYIDTGKQVKDVDIDDNDEQEFLNLVYDINHTTPILPDHVKAEDMPEDIYNFDDHYYESKKKKLEEARSDFADQDEVDELYLYANNNSQIYHNSWIPIVKNLLKKIDKGIFDESKVVIAMKHLADWADKLYKKEFGNERTPGFFFSPAVRKEVAHLFAVKFMEELKNGELEHLI